MARANGRGNDARAATAVGVALVTGLLGIGWTHVAWVSAHGQPVLVRLVQTNIPQSMKFDPARFEQALDDAMHLANLPPKAEDGIPQLIILHEKIGRAEWRERVCHIVLISVVAVSLTK